jgi:hypothetical protein
MKDGIRKSFPLSSGASKIWCTVCVLVLMVFSQMTFHHRLIVTIETSTRLNIPTLTDISTSSSQALSSTSLPVNTSRSDYLQGVENCPRGSLPTTKWWKYFQEVTETNKAQAAEALKQSEQSPPPGAQPRIPHRLIFTHQYNLFDCESKDLTPVLNMLASNARETIALYRQFWGEPSAVATLLTDEDCMRVLNATEPRLLEYFAKEQGMFKADMCWIAELYLHGGSYFDVDMLAVHPASPPDSVGFSSVRPEMGFFQAFTASAPGHPILKKSLEILLEVYTGKRKREGPLIKFIGPAIMHIAYESYLNETLPEEVSKDLFFMDEISIRQVRRQESVRRRKPKFILELPVHGMKVRNGFTKGGCNYVVHDNTTQYFYSRVNGTSNCHRPRSKMLEPAA